MSDFEWWRYIHDLTPRNEIASCEETAYESLPLKDAATLLFFTSQSELIKFAQQVSFSPIPQVSLDITNPILSVSAGLASKSYGC